MASSTERGVQLKSPVALPPCIPAPPVIEFLHPHYSGPDALFRLPKLDLTPSVSGVHYRTALLACQIVANNAFDGYLATDRDGEARVVADDDDLLTGNKYWFIADANNPHDNYPIVPRFEDWIFPHEEFQGLRWRFCRQADWGHVKREYGGGGTIRSSSASSGRKRSYSQVTRGDSEDGYDQHSKRMANSRVHEWVLHQDHHDWDGSHLGSHADEADGDFNTAAETGRSLSRKRRSLMPSRRDQIPGTLPSLVVDDNASSDGHDAAGSFGPQSQGDFTLPPTTSAKPASGGQERNASEIILS
ncbi:hypothetical protein DHEL01_v211988 [Diaporthe helianthi]|uniref:Uncharacterized protein n=1 Tax=Diaporthe helianthi TaxID=158607 RepID=A0A2P5HH90_DIAHE|nr:hypothetical protein DHEL01_v211988 [Diaporthe helianthi]